LHKIVAVPSAGASLIQAALVPYGINASGVIVGQYVLGIGGAAHGFVAIPPSK
jgi:hypothetical protein